MKYIYKLPPTSLVVRNPVEIVKVQIINVQDCRCEGVVVSKLSHSYIYIYIYIYVKTPELIVISTSVKIV